MKIILVRHGESEADILKVHEGRADFALTDKGRKQVELMSAWLCENEEFYHILSSPLKRASETAESISKKSNIDVTYNNELMEWNNGLLAGLSREDALKLYPIPEGGKKPHHEIADAESKINFRARAEMFLSRLKEDYPNDSNICIVSHGGMINMLFQSLMKLPSISNNHIKCEDTSIHKFIVSDDECYIEYVNRVSHLEDL